MTRYSKNLGDMALSAALATPMPFCRTAQAQTKLLALQTKCFELFIKRFLHWVIASTMRYFC